MRKGKQRESAGKARRRKERRQKRQGKEGKDDLPLYFFSLTPSEKKYSPGASLVPASKEPIMTAATKNRK